MKAQRMQQSAKNTEDNATQKQMQERILSDYANGGKEMFWESVRANGSETVANPSGIKMLQCYQLSTHTHTDHGNPLLS